MKKKPLTTAEWVRQVNLLAAEIDRLVALGADLHSQELCLVSQAYAAVCRAETKDDEPEEKNR